MTITIKSADEWEQFWCSSKEQRITSISETTTSCEICFEDENFLFLIERISEYQTKVEWPENLVILGDRYDVSQFKGTFKQFISLYSGVLR